MAPNQSVGRGAVNRAEKFLKISFHPVFGWVGVGGLNYYNSRARARVHRNTIHRSTDILNAVLVRRMALEQGYSSFMFCPCLSLELFFFFLIYFTPRNTYRLVFLALLIFLHRWNSFLASWKLFFLWITKWAELGIRWQKWFWMI